MSSAAAGNETITSTRPAKREPALPLRNDTFLGVCEAIGQDLGFNANFLRVPLAVLILWNPLVVIASYLVLGCAVALSRWLFPATIRQAATVAGPDCEAETGEPDQRLAA